MSKIPAHPDATRGALAATSSFLIWGIVPVYWKQLAGIAPLRPDRVKFVGQVVDRQTVFRVALGQIEVLQELVVDLAAELRLAALLGGTA